MKDLKKEYEEIIDKYIKIFIKKQELECPSIYWIGSIGETLCINDYFINFRDIKYDIDNEIEKDKIFEWHDYDLEYNIEKDLDNVKHINYKNYLKGVRF